MEVVEVVVFGPQTPNPLSSEIQSTDSTLPEKPNSRNHMMDSSNLLVAGQSYRWRTYSGFEL
jgi:hypothetical protein